MIARRAVRRAVWRTELRWLGLSDDERSLTIAVSVAAMLLTVALAG